MQLAQLRKWLPKVEIPESENREGFLEAICKQHNENINSRLYAYFINCPDVKIRSLFTESLIELIKQKSGKTLRFTEPVARLEIKSGDGKIDIVISDSGGKSAILIENKIYHWLHNDLLAYWNYKPEIPQENKVGVLLTLNPHEIPKAVKGKFINLTHADWVNSIRKNLKERNRVDKPWTYLYDFLNTLENISNIRNMDAQAKFYFDNAKAVLAAQATMGAAHTFLNNQLQKIADQLGWQLYGSEMEWKNIWDEKNNLDIYFTILLEDLLNGKPQYTFIIELGASQVERKDDLRKYLRERAWEKFKLIDRIGDDENTYMHFACKTYEITQPDLEQFAETVIQNVYQDFAEIMIMAVKYLYPKNKKFDWEPNWLEQIMNQKATKSKKR